MAFKPGDKEKATLQQHREKLAEAVKVFKEAVENDRLTPPAGMKSDILAGMWHFSKIRQEIDAETKDLAKAFRNSPTSPPDSHMRIRRLAFALYLLDKMDEMLPAVEKTKSPALLTLFEGATEAVAKILDNYFSKNLPQIASGYLDGEVTFAGCATCCSVQLLDSREVMKQYGPRVGEMLAAALGDGRAQKIFIPALCYDDMPEEEDIFLQREDAFSIRIYKQNRQDLTKFYKALGSMGEEPIPAGMKKAEAASKDLEEAEGRMRQRMKSLASEVASTKLPRGAAAVEIAKLCVAMFVLERVSAIRTAIIEKDRMSAYAIYEELKAQACKMLDEGFYRSGPQVTVSRYLDIEPMLAACSELCGFPVPEIKEIVATYKDKVGKNLLEQL